MLNNILDAYPFFMYNNEIPIPDLKMALQNKDFFVLRQFLGVETLIEESNPQATDECIRICKFKLLLSIDQEGVQDFMKKNWSASFMNKNLQEAFSEANTSVVAYQSGV